MTLDPASGETIDEFHELAAEAFENLAKGFDNETAKVVATWNSGMVSPQEADTTVGGSGAETHGGEAEESVPGNEG